MPRDRIEAAALTADLRGYLRQRGAAGPMVVLLLLAMAYPFAASSAQANLFVALCAVAACVALRGPRWLRQAAVCTTLLVLVWTYVFTISTGPQDAQSDRDDAVEQAAEAFLSGTNPWGQPTRLGTPVSTGPASILMALPAVAVTRQINAVSFVFYVLFFAALLAADLRYRNDTFTPLGLFFISGFLGFQYDLYWSLDELAWAYVVLFLGWRCLEAGWFAAGGACLALAILSRVSYAFPVFAFLCWFWFGGGRWRSLLAVVGGAAGATAAVIAPFALIAGRDLLTHNPLTIAGGKLGAPWPDTNPMFRALNSSIGAFGGATAPLKVLLVLAVIWYTARRVATTAPSHPFWHMTFAALLANFFVYAGILADDYTIFFAIPALLAIAHTPSGFAAPLPTPATRSPTAPARRPRAR